MLFIVSLLPIVSVVNFIGLELKPMEVNAQSIINLNRLMIRPAEIPLIGTGQGLEMQNTCFILCSYCYFSLLHQIFMQKCKLS